MAKHQRGQVFEGGGEVFALVAIEHAFLVEAFYAFDSRCGGDAFSQGHQPYGLYQGQQPMVLQVQPSRLEAGFAIQ